jgi:cytochrome c oxidase subunit 2
MNAFLYSLATAPSGGAPPTFWLPRQASTVAPSVDFMFMVITWISYIFFALIVGLMVLFVLRYRQRGAEIHPGGPSHNTPLEVTWTVIPTIIVVFIFFGGFKGYLELVTPPQNAYKIDVVAQKWAWLFKYPNGAQSDDLYVPAGRPVQLSLRSEDVLHSLFIPEFRVKKDVVPGRTNTLWFQSDYPTLDGTFRWLFCTEYCGDGHSRMNRKVFVLPEADFAQWEIDQANWLEKISPELLYKEAGPKLYARCASCHTLDGKPGTGPSWGPHDGLPAIWERTQKGLTRFADGTTLKDYVGPGKEFETPEDYLRQSILVPGKHLIEGFGNAMPTFQGQLNEKGILALEEFMKRLDEFDSKGVWKGPAK